MRELSQQLGVSVATVSMVLNNRPGISEETRARVLAAARESGYDIERLAAAPSKRKNELILVIFKIHGRIIGASPFFSVLIESIERTAASEGHTLNIRYVSDRQEMIAVRDALPRDGGLILLGTELSAETITALAPLPAASVVLDNTCPCLPVNSVAIDNAGGITQAVEHLAELGHRRIGYLKSEIDILNFEECFAAYCSAADRLGLERGEVLTSTQEEIARRLEAGPLSTSAFVTDTDMIALQAINTFREHGLRLGEDISVIGFDDLPVTQINDPPLTSVRVFNDALGETAVRRVIDLIQNPDQPFQHILVGTALKIRGSVKNRNTESR